MGDDVRPPREPDERRPDRPARGQGGGFYGSLGADFDLVFTDLADRDAGFYQHQYGDGGAAWWNASDFPRYGRFIGGLSAATGKRVVVWQIPMGNTLMRATNDTWGHYADNRPEWFLDDVSDGNLASWRDGGVVALLFGGGAGGTTCACDGLGDGMTNPPASGTHTRASLSADDDGGYLRDRVGGVLRRAAGSRSSPATPHRRPRRLTTRPAATRRRPRPSTSRRRPSPRPSRRRPSARRHEDQDPRARVGARPASSRRRDLRPEGARVKQRTWTVSLAAGHDAARSFTGTSKRTPRQGTVHGQGRRLPARLGGPPRWNDKATTFRVVR